MIYMTLNDFIAKWSGKPIDFDGWYGAQCVDLMNQYCVDVLGISNPMQALPGATAYEIYQNANDSRFTKITNTPSGIPQSGDIIFWSTNHVAVFIQGDTSTFTSFDQNFPTGSNCHVQLHNYTGVAGWIHPIISSSNSMQVDPVVYTNLVTKATNWDTVSLYLIIDSLDAIGGQKGVDFVKALQKQIKDQSGQLDTANQLASSLSGQNDTLAKTVTTLQKANDDAHNAISNLTTQLTNTQSNLSSCLKQPSLASATGKQLLSALFNKLKG